MSFSKITEDSFRLIAKYLAYGKKRALPRSLDEPRGEEAKTPEEYGLGLWFERQGTEKINISGVHGKDCVLATIKKSSEMKTDAVHQIAIANSGAAFTRISIEEGKAWGSWTRILMDNYFNLAASYSLIPEFIKYPTDVNIPYNEAPAIDKTFQAKVKEPGLYKIMSDKVNGMFFLSQGGMDDIGEKKLLFTSLGTPEREGVFDYNIRGACRFKIKITFSFSKIYDSGANSVPLVNDLFLLPRYGAIGGSLVTAPDNGIVKVLVKISKGKNTFVINCDSGGQMRKIDVKKSPEKDDFYEASSEVKKGDTLTFASSDSRYIEISNLSIEFKKTENE